MLEAVLVIPRRATVEGDNTSHAKIIALVEEAWEAKTKTKKNFWNSFPQVILPL
ncbi:hypothetical protein [Paenibacillus stellifer]|uniref:hypothetical protein n=1 Tax=Paenibacillus stellifer TaxID=169760 RepID=UPI000A9747DF|nr:hypothetical protein [Paenibacillus stellifer]